MNLSSNLSQPFATAAPPPGGQAIAMRAFPVQRQLLSSWCWAASTLGLTTYYRSPAPFIQPQFVARYLPLSIGAGYQWVSP
ncbi:MAG TPA: hypothetical protein VMH27_09755 [Puia sp.]|nr:hypothetical protein [Puia sp.]